MKKFDGAHAEIQHVDVVLIEVADPQLPAGISQPRRWTQIARQNLQQGRFTGTVFTDLVKTRKRLSDAHRELE